MYYYRYGNKGFLKSSESFGSEAEKAGKNKNTDNVFTYIEEDGSLRVEKQPSEGMLVQGGQLGSADETKGDYALLAVIDDQTTKLLDYRFATKSSAMSCLKGISLTYPTVYAVKLSSESELETSDEESALKNPW